MNYIFFFWKNSFSKMMFTIWRTLKLTSSCCFLKRSLLRTKSLKQKKTVITYSHTWHTSEKDIRHKSTPKNGFSTDEKFYFHFSSLLIILLRGNICTLLSQRRWRHCDAWDVTWSETSPNASQSRTSLRRIWNDTTIRKVF